MKKSLIVATALGALLISTPKAEAKIFEVWAQGLVGGAFGAGSTDRDFYKWAGGGVVGAEAGVKILFIGLYVDYLRFFGGETGANLIGFNLGGDGTIELTEGLDLVLRAAGTFYIGSVDNAGTYDSTTGTYETQNIQTRGFGAKGGIGLRYTFLKVMSVGATPTGGFHYFFGGANEDPTQTSENSTGWDFQAMAYFRVGFGI
jgi:hypothetical protein